MRWTVVAISSGVVLGGAVLASRALLSDPELPPPPPPAPAQVLTVRPPPVAPPTLAPPPPQPSVPPQAAPPPPPPAALPAPAMAPPPPPSVRAPPPPDQPEPDDISGPWEKDSRELAYAESLLAEDPPVLERLTSARDVFERCLAEQPDHERCNLGARRARALLAPLIKAEKRMMKPIQQIPLLREEAAEKRRLLKDR